MFDFIFDVINIILAFLNLDTGALEVLKSLFKQPVIIATITIVVLIVVLAVIRPSLATRLLNIVSKRVVAIVIVLMFCSAILGATIWGSVSNHMKNSSVTGSWIQCVHGSDVMRLTKIFTQHNSIAHEITVHKIDYEGDIRIPTIRTLPSEVIGSKSIMLNEDSNMVAIEMEIDDSFESNESFSVAIMEYSTDDSDIILGKGRDIDVRWFECGSDYCSVESSKMFEVKIDAANRDKMLLVASDECASMQN